MTSPDRHDWLIELTGENLLAVYDVVLDIRSELQLGDSVEISILPPVIKFRSLMPADGIPMRDRYCNLRWKATSLLKEKGVIRDFQVIQAGHRWMSRVGIAVDRDAFPPFAVTMDREFDRRESLRGTPEGEMGRYDIAQVCVNGHVVTSSASRTELREAFCTKCGSQTIMNCEHCDEPIRGYYHLEGVVGLEDDYVPPRFCHQCGSPYPWTTVKLQAARELADELDGLKDEERELLKHSLDELVREAPNTEVAAIRVKKILKKAGTAGTEVMKKLLIDIISETTRKTLGM